MPKIISYTPGWLSRPSPGFQLFNTAQSKSSAQAGRKGSYECSDSDYLGPNRIIAQRGTEVFLAAGKHVRWADLVLLKDGYEEQLRTPSKKSRSTTDASKSKQEDDGPEDASYRILKLGIGEQIRQLSVSPNGNLLAIATSHTVHIAILPDSSHLGQIPNKAIRLKTYYVGPTIHVLSQSQVTNILWHPCGAGGNCLVTVTADAVIRLWEFNSGDKSSVDRPSLGIDLKKLCVGTSEAQNFAPDDFMRNRGFSVDNVDMEVASACFGGSGSNHESGWSSMTLWIAMKGGDVYAMCPLLPSAWQPSATLLPSLSMAAVAQDASQEKGIVADPGLDWQCRHRFEWIKEVDRQEPTMLDSEDEFSPEIYKRPSHPGPIPRLQGPFQMFSEDIEQDLEFCDIHVVAPRIEAEEFENPDDSDSEVGSSNERGLSASIVVLMTTSGRGYVCLDLEGVQGQWLPSKTFKHPEPAPKEPYLVVLEGLDILSPTEQLDLQWPTFSHDVNSRYSLFATHSHGVFYFSFDPWIDSLERELQDSERLGAPLRIDLIKTGPGTLRERVLSFDEEDLLAVRAVPACLGFFDSDLGYFLLTSVDGHPQAATFDNDYPQIGRSASNPDIEDGVEQGQMPNMSLLNLEPARTVYQPSDAFYAESSLPRFLEKNVQNRHRRMVKEEVRLSTATLDLMTEAHRVLSQETHRLGLAASDLFRRCERLREELSDQIGRTNDYAQRIEKVAGEDADPYLESIRSKQPPSLQERLEKVRSRQQELTGRYENLRKKCIKSGGRPLSEKERLWISEVDKAHMSITEPSKEGRREEDSELTSDIYERCLQVKNLKEELIARSHKASQDDQHSEGEAVQMIPDTIRRSKLLEVKKLLTNQTRMIEDAQIRLQRLSEMAVS